MPVVAGTISIGAEVGGTMQTWGGEEVVCENKLWSALAGVFDAPMTMTNRAQKMKQVWTQFRLARLTKSDAQSFSEKLEVPPIDGDLLFAKSHPIAQQWPGCKRTQLPEGGAVGRASNRGTSMAGGNSTAQGRNGVASGKLLDKSMQCLSCSKWSKFYCPVSYVLILFAEAACASFMLSSCCCRKRSITWTRQRKGRGRAERSQAHAQCIRQ